MALRTPEKDSALNPSQSDYDRKFDAIARQEDAGTFDDIANNYDKSPNPSQDNANIANAKNREDNPSTNGVTGSKEESSYGGFKSTYGRQLSRRNAYAVLKKRGPIGLIITLFLGGGGLLGLLFSPGLILVQMKEALVDRFNTQLTSMDARTESIMRSKVSGTTTGLCKVVNVACKYATMSATEAKRFADAGIQIDESKSTVFGTRVKPGQFIYNNEKIPAKDFMTKYATDEGFRNAVKSAYNPKFAGFADNIWNLVKDKLGINKTRALPDGTDAEKEKAIEEDTKNGTKPALANDAIVCDNNGCKKNGVAMTPEEASAAKAAQAGLGPLDAAAGATEQAGSQAITAAESTLGTAAQTGVNTVADTIKITGYADLGCQAYGAVRTLGFLAKTVRAIQLARYAMIFINTADQIKAGTAKPQDVAYLGGILTSLASDAAAGAKRKAAMDSFGMQYALYGTVGKSDSYVSQFMAGGGLTGDLITLTDFINTSLGGSPAKVCAVLANTLVQLGSLAAGLVMLFIPGVGEGLAAKDVVTAVATIGVTVALQVLPNMLKDIVAGTITHNLLGEDAGNAIASGAGTIMSASAMLGGNGPMSKVDAAKYALRQDQVVAQYGKDEASSLSPLDPSNRYTFLGSIVASILPYISQSNTVGTNLNTLGSIVFGAFSNIIPKTNALTTAQYTQSLNSCNDVDYAAMNGGNGIATDPFCNVIYGIPTQYLNQDPTAVANDLASKGQIDAVTGAVMPGSAYETFINNCINRDRPLADPGQDSQGSTGEECIISDQNNNVEYYLYYVDQRVQTGMDTQVFSS